MSNSDADEGADHPWEDRGDLAWNEFDWERYLRGQEETIVRYLRHYEDARSRPDRIDFVAVQMGWGSADWPDDEESGPPGDPAEGDDEDVYTLHQNPVYIATKAIHLSLVLSWERFASDERRVPQAMAVALLAAVHRAGNQAIEAIHALDFGDFALAVSLFKRALAALNSALAVLNHDTVSRHGDLVAWREQALPRFFDLREIWLRVIAECRDELERPVEEDDE